MAYDHEDDEVLQRLRRLETRFMRLCAHFAVDVTDNKVRVVKLSLTPPAIAILGYDVSFGDALAYCRRSGINGAVTVFTPDKKLVGSLVVDA
jgi:hypothetical protein